MKIKDQLSIIAALIMTKIFVLVATYFLIPAAIFDTYIYFFYAFSNLILVVYLYKYIRIDKQLNLSVIPIVMIVVAHLYFMVGRIVQTIAEEEAIQEGMMDNMLQTVIPSLVVVSGELILGILLVNNKAEEDSAGAIKWVGYSYIAVLAIGIISMIISALGFWSHLSIVSLISSLLPLFAMQYMYRKELKRIQTES